MNLIDRLNADGRVQTAGVILPLDSPLMDEHHTQICDAFNTFCDRHAISKAEAARKAGISASALSQYLKGNYKGDRQRVGKKINGWLMRESKVRHVRIELPYVRTRVAEAMRRVVGLACDHGKMAAIVAPAGSGKTKLMKLLADERSGPYVYCDQDLTPSALVFRLSEMVRAGVPLAGKLGGTNGAKARLINKLKGTERPIFLDEAHLLPPRTFAHLRSIFDQSGSPIIMTGAYDILERVDDRSTGQGQLARRCIIFNALEHFANVEGGGPSGDGEGLGQPLYSLDDIRRVFEHMPLKLTEPALEMLWALACLPKYGCLGIAKDVVDFAWRSYGEQQTIGLDQFDQVMQTLFGLRADRMVRSARRHRETFREAKSA
ncbi:MAG: AAA family ATPase [Planctomycetota bacterium]